MRRGRLCTIVFMLGVWLGGTQAGFAYFSPDEVSALAQRLWLAGHVYQASQATAFSTGPGEDLQLFWLAEVLEAEGQKDSADRCRAYLKSFFEKSPLLPILPKLPKHVFAWDDFTPDPDMTRLFNTALARLERSTQQQPDRDFLVFTALLLETIDIAPDSEDSQGFNDFLEQYPDSVYSGWAAYQLAWLDWLQNAGSTRALREFAVQHKNHPLAAEALEAVEVPYFPPRQLARMSTLLPGWGEEALEPGLRQSAGLWYSELLFAAGAVGFALAAQNSDRLADLTGSLIFANLLFFNHQGSAEKAFALAQRRNWAEKNKFSLERRAVSLAGEGHFPPREISSQQPATLDQEGSLSMVLQTENAGSGFAGQGLVDESQLSNLGFKAEYLAHVLDLWRRPEGSLVLGLLPQGRFFFNHANPQPGLSSNQGLQVQELAGGVAGALTASVGAGESSYSLRLSAGAAWRSRKLQFGPWEYSQQGAVQNLECVLAWGGKSGAYWQSGIFWDEGPAADSWLVAGKSIAIPSRSLGWMFGLGIQL